MGRSVLIVAYYFPPWGGGPVLRTLKVVKYLQPLGWQISVLTAQDRYYEAISHDPSLLAEAGAARVVRTRSLQPTGGIARGLVAQALGAAQPSGHRRDRIMLRLARAAHQLLIPDDKLLWLPFGILGAMRLARQVRPDVIYVTSPPHSTGLLGLALRYALRRPMVLDVRDDWIGNPLYRRTWRFRAAIEGLMERAIIGAAAAVLVPTEASRSALARRYPDHSNRFQVVPNGFDDEDIDRARKLSRTEHDGADAYQLQCIYAGLITIRRNLVPFLEAIRHINAGRPRSIHLRLAGFLTEETREALKHLGLSRDVTELGYLPHPQALRSVIDADVAVVISSRGEGSPTAVPSKLYEYVACGAVVLGLVDEGAAGDLIRRNDWGVICAPDDEIAIERTLRELLALKRSGALAPSAAANLSVLHYGRRAQAERVSAILDAAIYRPTSA